MDEYLMKLAMVDETLLGCNEHNIGQEVTDAFVIKLEWC